jgi:hypothetical protein
LKIIAKGLFVNLTVQEQTRMNQTALRNKIIKQLRNFDNNQFENIAFDVFDYQKKYNRLYQQYLELLGRVDLIPNSLKEIPFLPIEFFKSFAIKTGAWDHQTYFTSSGTTLSKTSKHFVRDLNAYSLNTQRGFEQFYGPVDEYLIIALLPSYLERSGSSLIYMINEFISRSKYQKSGFFLNEYATIELLIKEHLENNTGKVLLVGVSFALLDFVENVQNSFGDQLIVMETGGMKGRRKELIRSDLHERLKAGFGVSEIHSEYGMTELLSQAYSKGNGQFECTQFMKILVRDLTDPFSYVADESTGGINVIDLQNIDTIAFIATEDLGLQRKNGMFEIKGRIDFSDIRGCNLLF